MTTITSVTMLRCSLRHRLNDSPQNALGCSVSAKHHSNKAAESRCMANEQLTYYATTRHMRAEWSTPRLAQYVACSAHPCTRQVLWHWPSGARSNFSSGPLMSRYATRQLVVNTLTEYRLTLPTSSWPPRTGLTDHGRLVRLATPCGQLGLARHHTQTLPCSTHSGARRGYQLTAGLPKASNARRPGYVYGVTRLLHVQRCAHCAVTRLHNYVALAICLKYLQFVRTFVHWCLHFVFLLRQLMRITVWWLKPG